MEHSDVRLHSLPATRPAVPTKRSGTSFELRRVFRSVRCDHFHETVVRLAE